MSRDPVPATPRKAMTLARKLAIHEAWNGKCGMCRGALPVTGPSVVYDHMLSLMLGGPDENANVQLLCASPCNKIKTAADAKAIAKLRRLIAEPTPSKNPIRSRGFDKSLTKGFDGRVRRRA